MRYLVDTNIFSALLRPATPIAFLDRYEAERSELATASLVLHELRYGADLLPARSRRRNAILAFIETQVRAMPVLAYDDRAAEWHAIERARLEKRGESSPFSDAQIAAVAAVNGLTLVTQNARDFRAFRGLRVESWCDHPPAVT